MKKISLLTVTLFAIFAFVAISSSVASAQVSQSWVCPAGYTCTPIVAPTVPVVCPTGYVCTPTVVNNNDSLIISPKGGEMYNIGDQVLIKWYEKNVRDTENYNIILEDSKTKIRKIIADSVRVGSSGIDGTSSFLWKIPQVESSGNYQIEVYRPEARELTMRSGNFTIKSTYSSPSPTPTSFPPLPITPPSIAAPCLSLSNNLKIGDISNDVISLHNFLIAKGYSFPSIDSGANPKDYFGLETLNAVMKYQRSVGVSDTGFVGPLTRGVINSLCNNNSGSVNNQSLINVISPSSGMVDSGGQFKVQWTGYSGNFDYYQVILGNSIANVEVSLDENTKISKYQNSYNSFAVWYFVKQITDKSGLSADKIKDAYYIKVNAIKSDLAGGGIVSTGKSSLFSVGSIANNPATIYVTAPSDGQIIKNSSSYLIISWKHTASTNHEFGINLLKINGDLAANIKTCSTPSNKTQESGSLNYAWKKGYDAYDKEIPNGRYTILVYDCAGVTVSGQSNNSFELISGNNSSTPSPTPTTSIAPTNPTVSINSPRQGETWSVGETKTISWNYQNFDSAVYGNKYVDVILVPSDGRESVKLGVNMSAPYNSIPVKIYEKTTDGRSAWLPGNYKVRIVCQATNAARFNSCYSESGYFNVISPTPSPSPTTSATFR